MASFLLIINLACLFVLVVGQTSSTTPQPEVLTPSTTITSTLSTGETPSTSTTPTDFYSTISTSSPSSSSSNTSSINSNTTTPRPGLSKDDGDDNEQGIDQGDDGVADDLADYIMNKMGKLFNNDDDSDEQGSEDSQDENSAEVEADLKNCSMPATLDRYCGVVPEDVLAYFNNDVSIQGILKELFDPEIVGKLHDNCTVGSWCLPDTYHQQIMAGMNGFYLESPFCSDGMWACLKAMMDYRYECHEETIDVLVNSVLLLCDLETVGNLGQECYTRAKEALYVTLADRTAPSGSQKSKLEEEGCSDFKVAMTKTYLCADDACKYDQQMLLTKFEMWEGMTDAASEIAVVCNITDLCQNDYDGDYYDSFDYYDPSDYVTGDYGVTDNNFTEEDYENMNEEMEAIEEELEEALEEAEEEDDEDEYYDESYEDEDDDDDDDELMDDNGEVNQANINSQAEQEDRTMLFGLVTMTVLLMAGVLGIAFLGYKRFRRVRYANYRRGYSQLTDEESKMLRAEYN